MRTTCREALSVLAYEPIVMAEIIVRHDGTYYSIREAHRHSSGALADCQREHYDHLTGPEALDVLAVLLSSVGPLGQDRRA